MLTFMNIILLLFAIVKPIWTENWDDFTQLETTTLTYTSSIGTDNFQELESFNNETSEESIQNYTEKDKPEYGGNFTIPHEEEIGKEDVDVIVPEMKEHNSSKEEVDLDLKTRQQRFRKTFSLKRIGTPDEDVKNEEMTKSVYNTYDDKDIEEDVLQTIVPVERHGGSNELFEETTVLVETKPKLIELHPDSRSLAQLLQDSFLRSPLAALVDLSPGALKAARNLWERALTVNTTLDIVLVPFNSTGIGEISYTHGGRSFRSALRSLLPAPPSDDAGGASFFGALRTSQLVPYDSAVFLSTDREPAYKDLAQLAATTLIKKRIRLYVLWFGGAPEDGGEITDGHLQEVAVRTGGEFIVIRGEPDTSAQTSEDADGYGEDDSMATLAVRQNLHGPQAIDLAVDSSIKSLLVTIEGKLGTAKLRTPKGSTIDLLNATSVVNFSNESRVVQDTTYGRTVRIGLLRTHNNDVDLYGEWALLTTVENNSEEYNLTVQADTGIRFDARIDRDVTEGSDGAPVLRLKVRGRLDSIGGVSLVDAAGREISRLAYSAPAINEDSSRLDREEVILPGDKIPDSDFYVRLIGKNDNDSDITRLSYVSQAQLTLASPTIIEMGAGSQLLVTPGTSVQIQFEITNQRDEPVLYFFTCRDEQRFLRQLQPQQMWLSGGQTATVTVTAFVPNTATAGITDKITLSAQAQEIVSKSANLQVIETGTQSNYRDTDQPTIGYSFGGRCAGVLSGSCAGALWTLEITAQDTGTGLLRISSTPVGIRTRSTYTAGTRDPVKAFYSASCCSPRVTLLATDLAGNQRSVTVDVNDIVFDAATIAAIVLGVLLLVALIVLIVLLVRLCIKRRRESRDLPAYRGDRTRI